MFIEKVLEHIWKDETKEYFDELKRIRDIPVETLFVQCQNDIMELNEASCFKTNLHTLTVLETNGCSHQFNDKKIGGCSFCDWDSPRVRQLARLKMLSQLDQEKYAEIIRFSFLAARGGKCKPCLVEQLSVHNIFDKKQFPDTAFELMFEKEFVYNKSPEIGIISARADYVTSDLVQKWKNIFRKSLTIGIGVECGNEWIRNYWLNKHVSNNQIIDSVTIIRANNAKVCANILLGIPALSEEVSLGVFLDTCEFLLKKVNVDYILISPLINKKRTIGGFLGGYESTISYRLLLSAVCGIKTWFANYIGRITFSPDNLKKMVELSKGDDLLAINELFEIVKQFGKVYTSNECNLEVEKYRDEILKVPSSEIFLKELMDTSKKMITQMGINDVNITRQLFDELVDDLHFFHMEELKWNQWKY